MLEAAEVLSNYKTKGTIKFIAFGAEEMGLRGSRYYAGQMSDENIAHTVITDLVISVTTGPYNLDKNAASVIYRPRCRTLDACWSEVEIPIYRGYWI
jgi:Zn-dependent M28 family amino/carboxypeptidase